MIWEWRWLFGRTLRREKFRRKVVEMLLEREGGGEFGGERGVISTERVGLNEISVNSGDHSIPSLVTVVSRMVLSLVFVAAEVLGLVRFMSKENF